VQNGTLTAQMLSIFEPARQSGLNILISGGTGPVRRDDDALMRFVPSTSVQSTIEDPPSCNCSRTRGASGDAPPKRGRTREVVAREPSSRTRCRMRPEPHHHPVKSVRVKALGHAPAMNTVTRDAHHDHAKYARDPCRV